MATGRSSFAKRQRDMAKKAKAAQKREKRLEKTDDVDELDEAIAGLAVRLRSGRAHDQRYAGVDLVVGHLAPAVVLAELPAVVAPQNNNCIVRKPFLF